MTKTYNDNDECAACGNTWAYHQQHRPRHIFKKKKTPALKACNDDGMSLNILLGEIASDSLKRKETPERYVERLEHLKELIDIHIDAAKS